MSAAPKPPKAPSVNLPANLTGLPLDHLAVAVTDLESASLPYKLLGLTQIGEDELVAEQRVRVRMLRAGESLVELLEPTSPNSAIAKFLDKHGAGLHHVAFRVENLASEIKRLTAQQAQFAGETGTGREGTKVIFLHPKWTGGVLVELVQHG